MKSQTGFALSESLIAILIFSIGLLGVMGFRSVAVGEVTESKVRNNASFLASALVSEMWSNRSRLTEYNSSGATVPAVMSEWFASVQRELPASSEVPPIVTTTPEGEVTIVMRWRIGGSGGPTRQYRITTFVRDP